MAQDHCPICGVKTDEYALVTAEGCPPKHRCDPKTLAAIDAAMNRDDEARLQGHMLAERLKDGFRMLDDDQ